jgi:hypothetical protein
MELVNCKKCGKVMLSKGSALCNDCMESQKSDIAIIRDYLIAHPRSTVLEIHSETGIPLDTISRLIQEKIISYR